MEFNEAYKTIVKRSIQKNTVEIPAVLSCLDFENLECLEIGAGVEARIASKLSSFAKHITCLESDKQTVEEINKTLEEKELKNKISPVLYKEDRFPFPNKSFDVVYCAWLPHKTATDEKFLEELARVTRKHVLLLMPGINGDEPELISIVRGGEKERREIYKEKMSSYLKSKGFKISYKKDTLMLDFKDKEEIQEVFYCLAFKNQVPEEKKNEIDKFLDARVHNYKDGFYIIHAEF